MEELQGHVTPDRISGTLFAKLIAGGMPALPLPAPTMCGYFPPNLDARLDDEGEAGRGSGGGHSGKASARRRLCKSKDNGRHAMFVQVHHRRGVTRVHANVPLFSGVG